MSQPTPWVSRFVGDITDQEIIERVGVQPRALHALKSQSEHDAARQLERALQEVFVPTTQIVSLLRRLYATARAYTIEAYPTMDTYLRGIYSIGSREPWQAAICITGLAGVGKSAVFKALSRLMPETCDVDVPGHANITARSLERLIMPPGLTSMASLLRETELGSEVLAKNTLTARAVYRDGVALIGIDEFQGIAAASTANTRATAAILEVASLGPPVFYIANYSLVHKFLGRAQQEQHRLLSRPFVVHVDPPGSDDWLATLEGYKSIAADVLCFDPRADGDEIHRLTAGIKRFVIALIVVAYRVVRGRGQHKVGIDDLREAYKSLDYSIYRGDVEALTRLAIEGRLSKRKDLVCPFPQEIRRANVVVAQKAVEHFERRLDEQHLISSMTVQEREAMARLQPPSHPTSSAKVVGIKRKKATAESLLAAQEAFQRDAGLTP